MGSAGHSLRLLSQILETVSHTLPVEYGDAIFRSFPVTDDHNQLPLIDQDRCTGCHACIDVCPTHALLQVNGKAVLAFPDRCTYCTACEEICPEGAISLPFLITFARKTTI